MDGQLNSTAQQKFKTGVLYRSPEFGYVVHWAYYAETGQLHIHFDLGEHKGVQAVRDMKEVWEKLLAILKYEHGFDEIFTVIKTLAPIEDHKFAINFGFTQLDELALPGFTFILYHQYI